MSKLKFAFLLLMTFGIISCSSTPEPETSQTAEALYNEAHELLDKTSYKKAAETFERVEMEHPYSKWATKAKVMAAYSYYRDKKYDDAIMALDRFIRFHPGNKDIAYAYYMKAMSYYEQISDVTKDQSNTEKALDALYQVTTRFPDSDFAKDANFKIDLTNDHLAGKEMEVGRYYLSQKNYLSALNRFSVVVNSFQTTSHIEEALYRQVELYNILGLFDEAQNAGKILNHNYPQSSWNKKARSLLKS